MSWIQFSRNPWYGEREESFCIQLRCGRDQIVTGANVTTIDERGERSMEATNGNRGEEERLELEWKASPRWQGIERPYEASDVLTLRGRMLANEVACRLRQP